MMIKHLPLLAVALIVSLTASAQTTKRIPLSNSDLPISAAVWAGDTMYVSGSLDPDLKTHTDTKSQTVGLIKDIQKLLESQKLTLSDVVMMHVYLAGDPAKEMDFDGMMPDIPNSSAPRTNRTSPRAPRCRWFCPLVFVALEWQSQARGSSRSFAFLPWQRINGTRWDKITLVTALI
jgi:enamine deaminase RidA (YjgF/YER057c/UK114 family)